MAEKKDIEVIDTYLKVGKVDEARERAKKILNKSPEDEKIRALLGLAYFARSEKQGSDEVEAYITLGKGQIENSLAQQRIA